MRQKRYCEKERGANRSKGEKERPEALRIATKRGGGCSGTPPLCVVSLVIKFLSQCVRVELPVAYSKVNSGLCICLTMRLCVCNAFQMRLMMEFTGENRGFCFVTYATRADAGRAVREADGFEIRPGRALGVCLSVDNNRLFIGGLPRQRQRDEILGEMRRLVDGVRDVIVYPDVRDKSRNRGFAFVEFETHRDAAMARRHLIATGVQLWGLPLAIDWAEPEPELDDDTMSKVRLIDYLVEEYSTRSKISDVNPFFQVSNSDLDSEHAKCLNNIVVDRVCSGDV